MGNFEEARRFNCERLDIAILQPLRTNTSFIPGCGKALLMEREPNNQQAQSLNQLIEKGVAREGYIGMALMGGAAALGGVVLAGLLRRRR
jgi:hypothetical protein